MHLLDILLVQSVKSILGQIKRGVPIAVPSDFSLDVPGTNTKQNISAPKYQKAAGAQPITIYANATPARS